MRTLVGEQTLGYIADLLASQGLSVRRALSVNSFRFGNDGVLISKEVAMFPARVGSNVFCIKAAVLGGHGSKTPLLLSKELMRRLGVVLDMKDDSCVFRVFNEKLKLCETKRGHYGIPLFKGFG